MELIAFEVIQDWPWLQYEFQHTWLGSKDSCFSEIKLSIHFSVKKPCRVIQSEQGHFNPWPNKKHDCLFPHTNTILSLGQLIMNITFQTLHNFT